MRLYRRLRWRLLSEKFGYLPRLARAWQHLVYRVVHWWRLRRGSVVDIRSFQRAIKVALHADHQRWEVIVKHDLCCYCQRRYPVASMTVEHVLPRSRGGRGAWWNLVGCCRRCNKERGAMKLWTYLMVRRGLLRMSGERLKHERAGHDIYKGAPLTTSLGELARWR